jgi:hypothetical protein
LPTRKIPTTESRSSAGLRQRKRDSILDVPFFRLNSILRSEWKAQLDGK